MYPESQVLIYKVSKIYIYFDYIDIVLHNTHRKNIVHHKLNKMEDKKQKKADKLSAGEGLLLISFILIMSGLGFADNKPGISNNEMIGWCISGTGFLVVILMMAYFVYKS